MALSALLTALPEGLVVVSANARNGPHTPRHSLLTQVLDFQASLVADLVHVRQFDNKAVWHRCVGTYLTPWLSGDADAAKAFTDTVLSHFLSIDQAKYAVKTDDNGEEGELLCDTQFSLAYGALLLLSHTHLRLFRGRRYGILGTNGSGKSTLMRQLRDGKVENFPPQDQLRCVMVEHSLQGENTSLSVIDFVASGTSLLCTAGVLAIYPLADKALSGFPRSKIRAQLLEVGFDDNRQAELVGGLSGGWKMKLELARAMLYNADLLLLDEVSCYVHRFSPQ